MKFKNGLGKKYGYIMGILKYLHINAYVCQCWQLYFRNIIHVKYIKIIYLKQNVYNALYL